MSRAFRTLSGAAAVIVAMAAGSAHGQPGPNGPGFRQHGPPGAFRGGPGPRGGSPRGAPQAPKAVKTDIPIYDVHVHVIGGRNNKTFRGAVDTAIATMNAYGIRKAVLMSPPRSPTMPANFDYPEFIEFVRQHPDRLAFTGGGGTLNPMLHGVDADAVTDDIRRKFEQTARDILKAGARGFGEISSLHLSLHPKHGYNFVPADHPLLLLLADIAAESDVPIDLHMDALEKSQPTPARLSQNQNPPTLPATIAPLRRLLAHNPKAKIVWAHGGSDHTGEMTAALVGRLMDHYPNLYMSLRPVPPPAPVKNKLFTRQRVDPGWLAVFKRHPDRFVIGNDSFFFSRQIKGGGALVDFSKGNEKHLQATRALLRLLPRQLARRIAFENAARIYKLGTD